MESTKCSLAHGRMYTKGNAASHKDLVDAFKVKYGHLFYTREINGTKEKSKLNPLKGAGIKALCKEAKFSATGLDQWATQDFAILSDDAYDWLAKNVQHH